MELPQEIFDLYNQFADDFIDNNFGKNCTLHYGTTKSECSNCYFNSVTGMSSNIYKAGGPISFEGTLCPYCQGEGYTFLEVTPETIKLRIYQSKKDWVKLPIPVSIADGAIQTIGHIRDLSKCKSAKYITVNTELNGLIDYRFTLAGEPYPHGFKLNRYFVAFWNRVS